MRTVVAGLALATVLLASVAAAAPGTATKQVRRTSGPVLALAADGDRAAFIVEGRVKEMLERHGLAARAPPDPPLAICGGVRVE